MKRTRIFEMSKGNNHLKIKDMKEKLLEAMNAGIFKAHLLLEYTDCTDLNEFCEAMLSLVREKKIRRSEVTGYYEVI